MLITYLELYPEIVYDYIQKIIFTQNITRSAKILNAKKILTLIIASAMMCTSLASCGKKDKKKDKGADADALVNDESSTEPATEAETVVSNADAVISNDSIDLLAKPVEGEAQDEEQKETEPAPQFEGGVEAETATAFLALNTDDWWVQYWGNDEDPLSYGAGLANIDGNGQYSVSLTADSDAARYAINGDASVPVSSNSLGMAAVMIKDGGVACPDAVITITSIYVDGYEVPLLKKNYTNIETGNIRANIFNEYVSDDSIPKDAKAADGALFEKGKPTDINDGNYSAQIVNKSDFDNWTNITVYFNVSGLDHDNYTGW